MRPPRAPPEPGQTGDLFDRPAAPALPRPYTVSELTRALRNAIEPRFRDVWVAGEVANLRRQASGHLYFTLRDALRRGQEVGPRPARDAQGEAEPTAPGLPKGESPAVIGAVLWASQARRLRFELAEGQEVLSRGFVEIYPPHGKYQLVVQEVEPRGAGAHALLLQQVKERLQRDGLLDPARKRPLPFLPRRIGVATSPTGAAVRDFLRVVHTRFPSLPVLVAPCRVQGEGAAATAPAAPSPWTRQGATRTGREGKRAWSTRRKSRSAAPVGLVATPTRRGRKGSGRLRAGSRSPSSRSRSLSWASSRARAPSPRGSTSWTMSWYLPCGA